MIETIKDYASPVPCFGAAGLFGAGPEAMEQTKRHLFIPSDLLDRIRGHAASDRPRPDHIAAIHRGLDDGVGRGRARSRRARGRYRFGLSGRHPCALARKVCTIEIIPPLAEAATKTLRDLGYDNVSVRLGDGYVGWPDAVLLTPSW